jgi:hypothetical protein
MTVSKREGYDAGHGRFRARGVVRWRRGVRKVNGAMKSAREMEGSVRV